MQKRKRTDPNRPNWVQQLVSMKKDVAAMPSGPERDLAHQRATQLEAAIGLDGWLRPTNRARPPTGPRPVAKGCEGYRFSVVGDKRVGWSIRAMSEGGGEEQLLGVYTTRDAAEDDLKSAAFEMRRHG